MWYVYGLRLKNRSIYTGSTNSVERRLLEHAEGLVKSTKSFRPHTLKFYIAVRTENVARSLEKYFKTGSGKAILKKRILSDEASA